MMVPGSMPKMIFVAFCKGLTNFIDIIPSLNKNIKITVNYILGPLLFLILSYLLYRQIINQPNLGIRWQQIRTSWQNPMFWMVFMMLFLNWGIEAVKWQQLLSPLEKINFFTAFKSVLVGCSVTMLTPNRTGEFGGRILFVKPENRIKAISATVVGSMSQLAITIITGAIGIVMLKNETAGYKLMSELPWIFNEYVFFISAILGILIVLLFFKLSFITSVVNKFVFLRKISTHMSFIKTYSGKVLLRLLIYSLFRYLVFILQYILLLKVMNVEIDFTTCFWLLAVFYLMLAIMPTIGFTELPVRAAASVMIIGLFSENSLGIQAAALGIWLINLVIPSLIGGIFILRTKIISEKQ